MLAWLPVGTLIRDPCAATGHYASLAARDRLSLATPFAEFLLQGRIPSRPPCAPFRVAEQLSGKLSEKSRCANLLQSSSPPYFADVPSRPDPAMLAAVSTRIMERHLQQLQLRGRCAVSVLPMTVAGG